MTEGDRLSLLITEDQTIGDYNSWWQMMNLDGNNVDHDINYCNKYTMMGDYQIYQVIIYEDILY